MVHCNWDTEACSSCRMDGRARLTMVESSPTMNRLMQQMARIRIRRRWLSSGKARFPVVVVVQTLQQYEGTISHPAEPLGEQCPDGVGGCPGADAQSAKLV